MPEKEIGKIAHYFNKIGVAAIELTGDLEVGDTIHVKGHTSDWTQNVDSMQIEHASVEKATPISTTSSTRSPNSTNAARSRR
jgi:hypothetical protein